MKLKIAIFLIMFSSLSSFTQEEKKVRFGVKAGVNLSNILHETYSVRADGDYKLGYQIGTFAKIKLVDNLYFTPELLYSIQGKKDLVMSTNESGNYYGFQKASIIEKNVLLPLLIHYYPMKGFNIYIGPQLDYFFDISVKMDSDEFQHTEVYSSSVSEYNFGVLGGIGYDFRSNLGVELRYNYGFNRINKPYRDELSTNNSVWMLNLNYTFN